MSTKALILLLAIVALAFAQYTNLVYAEPGGQFKVSVALCNTGSTSTTYVVSLIYNNETLDVQTLTLANGTCGSVILTATAPLGAGKYNMTLRIAQGSTYTDYPVEVRVYVPPQSFMSVSPAGPISILLSSAAFLLMLRRKSDYSLITLVAAYLAALYGILNPVCLAGICTIDYISVFALYIAIATTIIVGLLWLINRLRL